MTSSQYFGNILVKILPNNNKMDIFRIYTEGATENCLRPNFQTPWKGRNSKKQKCVQFCGTPCSLKTILHYLRIYETTILEYLRENSLRQQCQNILDNDLTLSNHPRLSQPTILASYIKQISQTNILGYSIQLCYTTISDLTPILEYLKQKSQTNLRLSQTNILEYLRLTQPIILDNLRQLSQIIIHILSFIILATWQSQSTIETTLTRFLNNQRQSS